jgi:DNA-directed RNA polymerase subunit alpha
MHPDALIATLEEGGRLEMQLSVSKGRGYASADDNKRPETIVGLIPIDSIFSPVTRVAYAVEPARVGQRTDFDKLTLEIETNGAIDPKAAISKAAAILREDLALFVSPADEDESEEPVAGSLEKQVVEPTRTPGFGDTPIEDLELGVRSYNCLKREGIETVADLVAKSDQELMCIPNFGRKSIEEVRERLAKNNLKLRGE